MDYLKFYKDINLQKQINDIAKKYKNKPVVIYGAGVMSSIFFENFDLSKLNITAVCDAKYKKDSEETFYGCKTIAPLQLPEADFDAVFIILREQEKLKQYIKYDLLINTKNEDKPVESLFKLPLIFMIKQILK